MDDHEAVLAVIREGFKWLIITLVVLNLFAHGLIETYFKARFGETPAERRSRLVEEAEDDE